MNKIAALLIQFGLSFCYENGGSEGELITTDFGFKAGHYPDGTIEVHYSGTSLMTDNENWHHLCSEAQNFLVQHTT